MSIYIKRISNTVFLLIVTYFLFLNIKGTFQQLPYHLLHIDERQVIDSILNVVQVNDEFNRFYFIENNNFKKILIVLSELFIGGNLDFGRLWNNIFIFIAGPFYFISPDIVIIVERLIQISYFYILIIYFSYNFVDKKKSLFFLIAFFSVPGAYYIIENPKPDSLVMLFLLIAFKKIFKDSKYNLGFIYIGISIGLKIIAIIPGLILGIYLIYPLEKITKLKEILHIFKNTIFGLIIGNPALLILHPKIYSRIFTSIEYASRYGSEKIFSFNLDFLQAWIDEVSKYYNLSPAFFFFLYFLVLFEVAQNLINKNNMQSNYFLITFLITSFFIIFNIERIWLYYLALPTLFLVFYILSLVELKNYSSRLLSVLLLILCLSGLNMHYKKISTYSFLVDEFKEDTMFNTISFINEKYLDKETINDLVYWDPDFYFPRQNITYNTKFKVLENWEEELEIFPLYTGVDFIVTKSIFENINNKIEVQNIGELYVYFIKSD